MSYQRGGEPHEQWSFDTRQGLGSFRSTIELHPRYPHFTRVCTGFANLKDVLGDGECPIRSRLLHIIRSVIAG